MSFLVGRFPVSPLDVCLALGSIIFPFKFNLSPSVYTVIFEIRLPRILAAMLVGSALSISGASFQGIFKNPLVSPDILGVAAGAGFGASLAILFGQTSVIIQLSAFCTGLIAVGLSYSISRSLKGDKILIMVLGGIAVAAIFTAFTSTIKYVADPMNKLPEIIFWLMGSLSMVNPMKLLMIIVPLLMGFTILMLLRWRLNLMAMGDEEAVSMGIDTDKLRIVVILASTLLTAAAVSISGIIGWVGLVIPHMARILVGPDHVKLLPVSVSLGAMFLLIVDDVSRSFGSIEIPLGILTAIIGVPVFIYLLTSEYNGWIQK
ncbi:MAG: iron ABC transporter permease [Methanobacterium sp. ERen5]|nr:MAG: iron ABC transporter permease [Methanobacterium sp. ERen5]